MKVRQACPQGNRTRQPQRALLAHNNNIFVVERHAGID